MHDTAIASRLPTVAEFRCLRQAVGWSVPDEAAVARALRGSLFGVVAISGGQTVGMARVVGDGVLWNYVQDVIVLPEYQRQGLGRRLMAAVMETLQQLAAPDSDVALIAGPDKAPFYERFGFVLCTSAKPAMRRKL